MMANKWFAAALGIIFAPAAFIYLAKWRIAAVCFLLLVGSAFADHYLERSLGFSFLVALLAVASAVYAFSLAKKVEFGGDRKWYSRWWGALLIPVFFLAIIILVRSFVMEPFSIPSASMSPTLEIDDHILVKKWGYGTYGTFGITLVKSKIENRTKPQRGEVVVVIHPHSSHYFVERVIGLPGDVVELKDKQLSISGTPVETVILKNGFVNETFGDLVSTVKYTNDRSRLRSGKWTVPDGHYFVLGDNRDNSADSRVWGMLPAENVVGRIIFQW